MFVLHITGFHSSFIGDMIELLGEDRVSYRNRMSEMTLSDLSESEYNGLLDLISEVGYEVLASA